MSIVRITPLTSQTLRAILVAVWILTTIQPVSSTVSMRPRSDVTREHYVQETSDDDWRLLTELHRYLATPLSSSKQTGSEDFLDDYALPLKELLHDAKRLHSNQAGE